MLNPKFIRENQDKVKTNTTERGMDATLVDKWLQIDGEKLELLQEIEALNKEKNELANLGKQSGNIDDLRTKGKELKEKTKTLQTRFEEIEIDWNNLINQIPNIHTDDVPKGATDAENVVARKVGTIPKFKFQPKDHMELAEMHDLVDFEAGAKVAGAKFYFLKNDLVKLEYALMQFGLDFLQRRGFTLMMTPDMAKSRFYLGTGYAPKGDEAQIYEIDGDDLGLIATAEITMAGLHADETIDEDKLPLKYAAISHCFRREAGSYGQFSKGLYRVHQFTKLEMFAYTTAEESEAMHQEMLKVEEDINQALGIPYQVLEMCTGDLGAIASKKYDLEAWMPGRDGYGEITSTSNTTDFQARNLGIRVKRKTGETEYLHMLNGTTLVSSRIPIAIMENFQQEDGSIKIPEVLVPHMGGQEYIGKK